MDKKEQGKKNRISGRNFELRVRKDLENKGFIVAKWTNNVQILTPMNNPEAKPLYSLIPAKRKYNPYTKFASFGNGFPDFLIFQKFASIRFGCEVKSNGYLTREERDKCNWLLANGIFELIYIAKKGKKRGEIIYESFKN